MSATTPVYAIKSLQTFNGRQGQGFSAILMCDGQPVADVSDEANGGMMRFHWRDGDAPRVPVTETHPHNGHVSSYKATPEEAKLLAHVATLPPRKLMADDEKRYPMDTDLFVDQLVTDVQAMRQTRTWLTRQFKIKTVVLDGDALREIKVPATDENLAVIRQKYPHMIILNPLPIEEAVRAAVNADRRKHGLTELPAPADAPAPKAKTRRRARP
jgi:hypothetical protein